MSAGSKGNRAARAGALGGLALLLLLLGWIELHQGAPLGLDLQVLSWVRAHPGLAPSALVQGLDLLGKVAVLTALGLAAAALAWLLGDRPLAFLASANALGLVVWTQAMKIGVARARPEAAGWGVHASGGGFPSGHATLTTGLCLVLWTLAARHFQGGAARVLFKAGLLLLPVLMGASRLFSGVHYLSDVVAGILLALTWFSVCSLWWQPEGAKD